MSEHDFSAREEKETGIGGNERTIGDGGSSTGDPTHAPATGALNPHTGQPVPDDPQPSAGGGDAGGASSASPDSAPSSTASGGTDSASAASETSAPSQQELAIRSALESVMDPEIQLSVIDLGLIREIHVQPEQTLIRMMLTTPFCPYAPQMVEDVKNAVQNVRDMPCEVELLPDAWSPDMMPDPGLLGYSF